MYVMGIDVGASHIGIGIVKKETLKFIYKKYIMYNYKELNNDVFINKLIESIYEALLFESNIEYIGIGMPGQIDLKNGIFLGNDYINLGKIDVLSILKAKFGINAYLTNDCTLAALAEISYGAFKEVDKGLMITIGSAVGTTCFKRDFNNKEIILSDDEFWQYLYDLNGDKKIKSLKSIAKSYKTDDRRKIFIDALNNNKKALEILNNVINDYYVGICRIYDNVGLSHFCIGGGISEYFDLFIKPLSNLFKNSKDYNCIKVYKSQFNNDSAIIGATLLPDNYNRTSKI